DFSRAITLNPKHPTAYRQRGLARQLKNDLDGANADFAKAAEIGNEITKRLRSSINALPRDGAVPSLREGVIAQVNNDDITASMPRIFGSNFGDKSSETSSSHGRLAGRSISIPVRATSNDTSIRILRSFVN